MPNICTQFADASCHAFSQNYFIAILNKFIQENIIQLERCSWTVEHKRKTKASFPNFNVTVYSPECDRVMEKLLTLDSSVQSS